MQENEKKGQVYSPPSASGDGQQGNQDGVQQQQQQAEQRIIQRGGTTRQTSVQGKQEIREEAKGIHTRLASVPALRKAFIKQIDENRPFKRGLWKECKTNLRLNRECRQKTINNRCEGMGYCVSGMVFMIFLYYIFYPLLKLLLFFQMSGK